MKNKPLNDNSTQKHAGHKLIENQITLKMGGRINDLSL